MAAIKSMDRISSKWATVAGRSADSYQDGVLNPRADWKANTKAAATNWKAGVQQAITNNSFDKGVDASSTESWQTGAVNKGVNRYAAGVSLAAPAYEAGFAPYRAVIAGLTLPKRGPKGDPANIERVRVVANALHTRKVAGAKG